MTPKERLETRKAELAELEIAQKRGELIKRSEVEAEQQECAEVLGSDLYGALPPRIAGLLAGRTLTAPEIRKVVLECIDEMVAGWVTSEIVPKPIKDGPSE